MKLGFVAAIFAELSLARDEGFACVELMSWPVGEAGRRFAGFTHLNVTACGSSARSSRPSSQNSRQFGLHRFRLGG